MTKETVSVPVLEMPSFLSTFGESPMCSMSENAKFGPIAKF